VSEGSHGDTFDILRCNDWRLDLFAATSERFGAR